MYQGRYYSSLLLPNLMEPVVEKSSKKKKPKRLPQSRPSSNAVLAIADLPGDNRSK